MEARCLISKMERAIEEVSRYIRSNLVIGAFVKPEECILSLSFHGCAGGMDGSMAGSGSLGGEETRGESGRAQRAPIVGMPIIQ